MKTPGLVLGLLLAVPACLVAQDAEITLPESPLVYLRPLVAEAVASNPSISAALEGMAEAEARVPAAGSPEPPMLMYERKEMPGFDWNQALYNEWELTQMLKIPWKYSAGSDILRLEADHAHHEHLEVVNEVVREVKMSFSRLWFAQQAAALDGEAVRQMDRLSRTADARYRSGLSGQEEMLMAQIERNRMANSLNARRGAEKGEKARLMQLLNRQAGDSIGYAMAEDIRVSIGLDSLIRLALRERPMLDHDSITIRSAEAVRDGAGQRWIPDLLLGVGYMDGVRVDFSGWSVKAGITLPFMPWSIPQASSGTDEADARIRRAREKFTDTRGRVIADVTGSYETIRSLEAQLQTYSERMIPLSERAMRTALTQYETGATDYIVVHNAVAGYLRVREEYFMIKMSLDSEIAMLEFAVGIDGLAAGSAGSDGGNGD